MHLAYIPSPSQGVWHLGPLPLRAYALCIIAGIVVAVWLGERRYVARGGQPGQVMDVAVWAVIFGLIGGRLYHVLTDPELYFGSGKDPVEALKVWKGGLGIWGAISLGALGAWIGCRRAGIKLAPYADAVAPGIVLAQAIGRWGNYFNQELFGKPTTLTWGLKIDPGRDGTVPGAAAYHPTFLYESLWDVGVAILVIYADRIFKLGRGRAFALYVMAYTVGRFWIEALRVDHANKIAGLRLNNWTSIIIFLGALAFFLLRRGPRETPEELALHAEPPEAEDAEGKAEDAEAEDAEAEEETEEADRAGDAEPAKAATAKADADADAADKASADEASDAEAEQDAEETKAADEAEVAGAARAAEEPSEPKAAVESAEEPGTSPATPLPATRRAARKKAAPRKATPAASEPTAPEPVGGMAADEPEAAGLVAAGLADGAEPAEAAETPKAAAQPEAAGEPSEPEAAEEPATASATRRTARKKAAPRKATPAASEPERVDRATAEAAAADDSSDAAGSGESAGSADDTAMASPPPRRGLGRFRRGAGASGSG